MKSRAACRPTSRSNRSDLAGAPLLFETGPGNGWLDRPMGAPCAVSARRIVRHRDLQPAAERHRLLDSEASGHSRPQLRRRRRQLRLSHDAGYTGAPVAGDASAKRAKRSSRSSRRSTGSTSRSARPPTARSSTSPGVGDCRTARSSVAIIAGLALVLGVVAWVRVTAAAMRLEGVCAGC